MRNLLSANLLRLKKSILFWGTIILMVGFSTVLTLNRYSERLRWEKMGYVDYFSPEGILFGYALIAGIVMAVFVPLFFSTEHSQGTIRNKLIAGHSRAAICLSSLIAGVVACILICAAYALPIVTLGTALLDRWSAPPAILFTILLESLLLMVSYCAIYTLIVINLSRKAGAAVSCILLFLALFLGAMITYNMLDAPEFHPAYSLVDGEMVSEMVRNPAYLTEDERPIYEFLLDLNPVGQGVQYGNLTPTRPVQLALCSLGIIAVTTAAGTALFKRKDLK